MASPLLLSFAILGITLLGWLSHWFWPSGGFGILPTWWPNLFLGHSPTNIPIKKLPN